MWRPRSVLTVKCIPDSRLREADQANNDNVEQRASVPTREAGNVLGWLRMLCLLNLRFDHFVSHDLRFGIGETGERCKAVNNTLLYIFAVPCGIPMMARVHCVCPRLDKVRSTFEVELPEQASPMMLFGAKMAQSTSRRYTKRLPSLQHHCQQHAKSTTDL